jgi:anti-sigma regulatory factor (Ser/Thr protein kinase)
MVISPTTQAMEEDRPPGGTALRYSASWDADALRIADARHAVCAFLERAGHPPGQQVSQDAQMVVSELVTNAVRHAPGPCGLLLELSPAAGLLRVTVWDTSARLPQPRPKDVRRVGGHGLLLVAALCERILVAPADGGKRVTAELPLSPAG